MLTKTLNAVFKKILLYTIYYQSQHSYLLHQPLFLLFEILYFRPNEKY